MIAVVALLLGAVQAAAAADISGYYETSQIEVAAALELHPDGRFRYALDYGAVSESAQGEWTLDGETVRLTTRPAPKAPAFELVRDEPAPKGELYMVLEDPKFGWDGSFHAIVTIDGEKEPALVAAGENGRVDLRGARVTTVQPLMPIAETIGDAVALSADRGHRLLFRFHPNDFSIARFNGTPLAKSGGDLVLHRHDATIRFIRMRP